VILNSTSLIRSTILPGVISILIIISSCSTNKDNAPAANEIATDSISVITDEPDNNEDKIIDEDHRAPGIADTKLLFEELEPAEQEFLLNLQQKNLSKIFDSIGFLMLTPGPGVQPISFFGTTVKDLHDIKEFDLLLNDSSFLNGNIALYSWHYDRCSAQDLPDGIYLNDTFITPIEQDLVTEHQLVQLKQLNTRIRGLEYQYSKDFNIRFTTNSGQSNYLTLRAFLRDHKLYLFMIDQRDCGA
jgi:hypothetical protein